MKYTIKDYEDIRAWVNEMTEEELLISVACPNVSPERPGMYHGVASVFFHTKELRDAGMEEVKNDAHKPLVVEDMESMFVPMRACANSGDETLAYQMGKCKAIDAVERGYHWGLGPCVDITGNVNCPVVNNRTPGRTTEENIKFGTEFIKGMQDYGIISTAKHFPGDGYCEYDQHLTTPENPLPFDEWMNTFGKSYKAFIDAGLKSIMPGHISLPSYDDIDEETGLCRPATLSRKLLTELLKKELGFEGIIITDAVNMGGFAGYMNIYRAYAESLEAGCDVLLFAHPDEVYLKEMHKYIENGVLSMETLKDRAYRVWCFARENMERTDCKKETITPEYTKELEYKLGRGAVELMRNRHNILPLKLDKNSKVLLNCIISEIEPRNVKGHKDHAEAIADKLRQKVGTVDVISDVGPDEEMRLVLEGGYDAVVCFITSTPTYGLNTTRVAGTVARNMMGGWFRMGVPTVFVTSLHSVYKEYEPCMDALINTNGSRLEATNDKIIELILG